MPLPDGRCVNTLNSKMYLRVFVVSRDGTQRNVKSPCSFSFQTDAGSNTNLKTLLVLIDLIHIKYISVCLLLKGNPDLRAFQAVFTHKVVFRTPGGRYVQNILQSQQHFYYWDSGRSVISLVDLICFET